MVAGLFASASGSAAPIEYSTTPLTTGWSTNGTVLAVQVVGDTVYAGGAFTSVRPSSGGASVARSNLPAFDVHTGALLPGFSASIDGEVRTLESDGQRSEERRVGKGCVSKCRFGGSRVL